MEPKVIVERQYLAGSDDTVLLQLIATLFFGTQEYRVYAPAKAKGPSRDWLDQSFVHQPSGFDESEVLGSDRLRILDIVRRRLGSESSSLVERSKEMTQSGTTDKRKVFVVYGRSSKACDAVFAFLRAIDLDPMEWGEVTAATATPTPFVGDAIEKGFSEAHAAVVLLTGDDLARVGKRYLQASDGRHERVLTPQPRPNVLFEAGMAFGKYPNRTLLVAIGDYRKFSDIEGRHVLQLSNSPATRQAFVDRLRIAGCPVKVENKSDWLTAGNFESAIQDPDIADGTQNPRLKMYAREFKEDPNATFKRKIWIQFRNQSDECLLIRQPVWRTISAGIRANIRQGTFQLQLGTTWCPEKIGTQQINLPPGDLCRLWAEPEESTSTDTVRQMCQADQSIGTVALLANGEEIVVPV